jgi:hypothetical protein
VGKKNQIILKNAYEQYCNHFLQQHHSFRSTNKNDFITFLITRIHSYSGYDLFKSAFIWSLTTEGNEYWCNLNDEWNKILDELKKG